MRDSAFHRCHPAVNFLFFVLTIGTAMLFAHPVYLAIAAVAALGWLLLLRGRRGLTRALPVRCAPNPDGMAVPLSLLVVILSPLANARGRDVLFRLLGRPITLQAVQAAGLSAAMLFLVMIWFALYAQVMTSDRFLHLFGRVAPSASLLVGMTLRLVPTMQTRITRIRQARWGLHGRPDPGRTLRGRLREGMHAMTTLMTWSLEDAILTADAMKARGYGLRRRSSFSLYRFGRTDTGLLLLLLSLFAAVMAAHFGGLTAYPLYPRAAPIRGEPVALAGYAAYAALVSLPLWLEGQERWWWR